MSSIRLIQRTGRIELKQRTGRIKRADRQIITARDTEATYFDKNGILQTAAPHEIRYSKNFETGKQDLLLEDESTNLATSISNWINKSSSTELIDDTGYKITVNANLGGIRAAKTPQIDEKNYYRSAFVKRGNLDIIRISTQYNGYNPSVEFDFSTGQLITDYPAIQNLMVQSYPDGFYRIGFSLKNTSGSTKYFFINLFEPGYFIIKYPQMEQGQNWTSPILTANESVTRAADKLVFAT